MKSLCNTQRIQATSKNHWTIFLGWARDHLFHSILLSVSKRKKILRSCWSFSITLLEPILALTFPHIFFFEAIEVSFCCLKRFVPKRFTDKTKREHQTFLIWLHKNGELNRWLMVCYILFQYQSFSCIYWWSCHRNANESKIYSKKKNESNLSLYLPLFD